MYSPKIKEDLIPILYRMARIAGKTMTNVVDELLRPHLIEIVDDNATYTCHTCRHEVDVVDEGDKGYCNHCESVVFIDKS